MEMEGVDATLPLLLLWQTRSTGYGPMNGTVADFSQMPNCMRLKVVIGWAHVCRRW
jgi:hypothetical protein